VTEAEKIRLIFLKLDSDQAGEQAAALAKVRELSKSSGRPFLRDLLHQLETTVPFEKYRELESERDEFAKANQGLAQQNTKLAKAAAPQRSRWVVLKLRAQAAGIAAVVVAGIGGVVGVGLHVQTMKAETEKWAALNRSLQERLALASLKSPACSSSTPGKGKR
jgi:hypothetical protein